MPRSIYSDPEGEKTFKEGQDAFDSRKEGLEYLGRMMNLDNKASQGISNAQMNYSKNVEDQVKRKR